MDAAALGPAPQLSVDDLSETPVALGELLRDLLWLSGRFLSRTLLGWLAELHSSSWLTPKSASILHRTVDALVAE